MGKVINNYVGLFNSKPYTCQRDWPEDCFCQAGEDGVVFTDISMTDVFRDQKPEAMAAVANSMEGNDPVGSYRTAFFEAFPRDPDTFIRGEGIEVEEAEESAWKQFEKIRDCESHEMERRGYTNGGGICKHCGMFSGTAFPPVKYDNL